MKETKKTVVLNSSYEKPEMIELAAPAKGNGVCDLGSANIIPTCFSGWTAINCSGGLDASAGTFCSSGTAPSNGCSSGFSLTRPE